MFRIFTRPKGAPINDPRVGQPMWSKPGTPLDRVAKRATYDRFRDERPVTGNREQARRQRQEQRDFERQCERGYVRIDGLGWMHLRNKSRGLRPVFPGELTTVYGY
ncbi:hypothetical protein SPS_7 [Sphingomonas phage Scott]|uniref:Uncharacterized protein n=1 Tax=Sphingomonas phage Scott TaxID=2282912 RepID=A0A346FDA4_9CAUD|nr:hypothetical protein HOT83_gp07 [Sphingomonas phage Scott]AXN53718.1 hypothetical protein SPS_7 [Sphingomonas phage Scott]